MFHAQTPKFHDIQACVFYSKNYTMQNFKATHAKPIDLHHLSQNCHRFSTILVAKGRNDRVHNNVFISGMYSILRNSWNVSVFSHLTTTRTTTTKHSPTKWGRLYGSNHAIMLSRLQ